MKGVIRIGDMTSHGGKVTGASDTAFVNGVAIARKGDPCICPVNGHTACTIAEGDTLVLDRGTPVAFDGHKTSCGAVLISSVTTSGKG